MLFNSWQFLLFFPCVTGVYFALPHRFRWAWLLAASCVFYMALVPKYLLVLAYAIGVDYVTALAIAGTSGPRRKLWLLLSVGSSLALLGFFKYWNFFNTNLAALAQLLHWNYPLPMLALALPVGLSFHIFQSLAYVIEVYRGNQAPERHLGIFALYVMFYPQLVAGPIERPQQLLHQFREAHSFDAQRVRRGLERMAWGFFKKVVVADRLAVLVAPVYAHPERYHGLPLIAATLMFAFQIYADFSGYADIALGAAEVMGFRLMENFRQPYLATSLGDFWRRWHMSLSSWFRDYVYIPLGGNRRRHQLNLLAVFALSGLWHGAAWTYVVWGLIHGVALVAESATTRLRATLARHLPLLSDAVGLASTFLVVCLAWIFFRAATLADAWYILAHLGTHLAEQCQDPATALAVLVPHDSGGLLPLHLAAWGMAALVLADLCQRQGLVRDRLMAMPGWLRWSAYQLLVLVIVVLGEFKTQAFIYFQF